MLAILLIAVPSSSVTALTLVESPAGEGSLAPRLVAMDGDRAVMSWLEATDSGHDFLFSEFDGKTFGPAHRIASGPGFFANWADTPGIRVGKNGQWLAHWLVRSGQDNYAYDVVMALSSDAGASWSEPSSPHDDGTLTEHGFVSTFADPTAESGFGAVWLDGRETAPTAEDRPHDYDEHHHHGSGSMTLRSACISAKGRIERPALLDGRVCDCCPTDAAATDHGAIVVYRDRSEDEIRDISLIRRVGSSWSDPVTVHPDGWRITGCPVNGPALLARGDAVIVAWFTMADDRARVQVAWSSDGGRRFGAPIVFDEAIALGRVDLAWSGDTAVLSWLAEVENQAMLRIARFDRGGQMLERRDLKPLDEGRISGMPRLVGLADGRVLATWTERVDSSQRPRVRAGWLQFDISG